MRGVIYCRISEDPTGRTAGVRRQEDECRALASSRGVEVLDVLTDNDISATTGKRRPGFERVLDMINGGQADTIVCWHTDRLYRLPRDLEPIIAAAEAHPVRFLTVTASELDLNTASGRMVARLLAAVSAQEVEHKSERQRSANTQRAVNGEPAARVGYGYTRDAHGAVQVVPEQAAVIREAVRRILDGESMRHICSDFQTRGIPTPGGARRWVSTTLRQLVTRESLAGLRRHHGVVVGELDPSIPRIVTRAEHDRLKTMMTDPSRRTNAGSEPKYLLGGIARCGKCSHTMRRAIGRIETTKTGRTKRQPASYFCTNCYGVRRKQTDVDDFVERVILARLARPDAADLFTTGGDADAAKTARSAMADIDARLLLVADAFTAGDIDMAQMIRATATLKADRARHEAVLSSSMPKALPADLIGPTSAQCWARLDMSQRRDVLRELGVTIEILPAGAGRDFDSDLVSVKWDS